MRIAIVTSSYPTSDGDPSGHFVASEARQLAREGHQICVFAPRAAPQFAAPQFATPQFAAPQFAAGNPSVHWLPGGSAFGPPGAWTRLKRAPWRALDVARFVHSARKELRRGAFDRVIAHWLFPAGFPLAVDVEAPLELVVHGSDARCFFALPTWVQRALLARWLRRSSSFRFVSHELYRTFLERCVALNRGTFPHGGVRADVAAELVRRSSVRPSPIDVPPLDREEARCALGLEDTAWIGVVVARLLPQKRVDVALRRAPVPERCQWVVIGDGPERARLERDFPRVRFLGSLGRPETLRWIAAADALVSASLHEGAPTVIREARALGTQVYSADVADVLSWSREDPGIVVFPELGLRA